jgi:hypothetical protein
MYIVPIAWLYVALMMAVAEATNTNGSVLGAVITFLLYGLAPVALAVYLMATPARKRAIKAKEAALQGDLAIPRRAAMEVEPSNQPDAGGHAATAAQADVVAPVRKEP